MNNTQLQLDLFNTYTEFDGKLFELFEKSPNREFKSHIQFIVADSLQEAEDRISTVNPEYWRTKSVRLVGVDYVWATFEKIHFSYRICKSILGIEKMVAD
jgi:hypothetical protein